jgi:FKBP-type peptidyl-prolyl cis-trans isomerase (trigger factor)
MLTPQLDSKLIGVSPGAIVKLNDNIPQLQIEDAEITVLVKEVREKILPDFTDEWVSDTTEFDDIKKLKRGTRKKY